MGLAMSVPPRDRLGDVRRQQRTQYAYVYTRDPVRVSSAQKKKKKGKGKTRKMGTKLMQKKPVVGWLRYDLMLLSRFPKGTSSRYKHLRAQRAGLGPLLTARERTLIRKDIVSSRKPWSEL